VITIRRNQDGFVDEVCTPCFHLEQMADNLWALNVQEGDESALLYIGAKRAPVTVTVLETVPPADPFARFDPDLLTELGLGCAGEET